MVIVPIGMMINITHMQLQHYSAMGKHVKKSYLMYKINEKINHAKNIGKYT